MKNLIKWMLIILILLLSISEFPPYANAGFWIEPQFIETEIDCECHKGEECDE